MLALRDLRQLVRVAEQDERAGARPGGEHVRKRELTRLVDEEHVERTLRCVHVDAWTRQRPGRPGDEVEGRIGADVHILGGDEAPILEGVVGIVLRRPLGAAESEALPVGLVLDRAEHVVDRLVAERGDGDALAGAHERDRHSCALPGLPRAGRPLDEEVALAERERRLDGVVQVQARLGRAPLEQRRQRRVRRPVTVA